MFDQQSPQAKPPATRPPAAEAVDMFAGGDVPAAPRLAQPFAPPPTSMPPSSAEVAPSVSAPAHDGGGHIVRFVFIFVVVAALVAGAGYAAYQFMGQTPVNDTGPVKSVSDNAVVNDTTTDEEDVPEVIEVTTPDEDKKSFVDSDGDGLTNAEELEAGTLADKADTDDDGLGDREEVEVYATDPREEDTDDDGFLDGQEVKGGYNPNGEGMLFAVPGL